MSKVKRKGHFFHVTYNKDDQKWHVREVKGSDVNTFDDKEDAINKTESMAQDVSMGHVVIHDENGKFKTFEHFKGEEIVWVILNL